MLKHQPTPLPPHVSHACFSGACLLVVIAGFGSITRGDESASPFTPGEISIGEPIALPFADDPAGSPKNAVGAPGSPLRSPVDAVVAAAPGTGWLGLSVAESNVPGRWRVDEVLAGGPAARAGMIPGDELRAINGITLESAEDVAEAMATIAAGQDVRVAVARNDAVGDLVLRADPRPAPRPRTSPEPLLALTQPAQPAPQPPAQPAFQPPAQPNPQLPNQSVPQPASQSFAAPAPQQSVPPAWQSAGEGHVLDAAVPSEPERLPAARFDASVPPGRVPPGRPSLEEPRGGRAALGVRTVPIDPALQARFSLPEPAGAYVIGVVQDLPASRAGVPPGSVIVALDNHPVRSPGELTQLVTSSPVDRPVTVQFVLPGGESKRADVVLQPLSAPLEQALTGEPVATAVPTLEPGPVPQRVERMSGDREQATILDEVQGLRQRLERLERRLENLRPTLRR